MNYKETVQYLFNSTPVFEKVGAPAYKAGLYNSLALDQHLDHPHTRFLTIHIAGTNGKGSCSHTLAAILQADGYKVGLYTSPHLVDFRERIRINGKPVSEKYVVDFVEQNRSFFEPLHPSFFELTTAMAFKYFADQKVDIAVIEVGLGGRLDCTNIITPILSVITNISFDHTQFLGNTLTEIAGEKAGIIKNGIPVVIGETVPETRIVFESKAQEMQTQDVYAEDIPAVLSSKACPDGGRIYETRYFGEIKSELGGIYQDRNANTILAAAIQLINRNIIRNPDSVVKGFASVCEMTGLRGRWEILKKSPLVICDTGHNVGGWQYLSKQIKTQDCKHRRIVFGMVNDKDISTVMGMLPKDGIYYWTQPSCKRAFPVEKVVETAKKYQLQGRVFPTVAEAYRKAMEEAGKEDFIFIGGSSYVVADLLKEFPSDKA
ncbi:MAG: bifunctional folylpolyglutamate synthase/dihydrofolate synthase [Prevotella sp.]|jgi:dihydrofolate synthase/folylpolyglutamate synthase|nr:folylpolyglutamate synthase/dihydrofolate synthase family protein [Prevotella sp.]MCH4182935.1 bifunctional folylpolyglutamate synthase/dihydrofolate synthase [Prevotella sp.]MCH4212599.1 bifunctional folylpolyglutamate synthase/dihydrofolate synthase [Prevotella sp.]MCH4241085.1 bifunctional folylpolyglutamate synthase/dihydrofolate synthase [Prevotella sp.]